MIPQSILNDAPSLVERMKALGLISVIPQRPPTTPTEIQAAKYGMTPTGYSKLEYERRCKRAAALGMTARQYQLRNQKPKNNKKRKRA